MEINMTFVALSLINCEAVPQYWLQDSELSIWKQTVVGCSVLNMLQYMYKFNVTYIYKDVLTNDSHGFEEYRIDVVDIYVRPRAVTNSFLDHAYPLINIFSWRYGLTYLHSNTEAMRPYYSLPFTRVTWHCLYLMTIIGSTLFYLMRWWEKKLVGGRDDLCFGYELLIAIAAFCQHVLPTHAVLQSRRMCYWVFMAFSYVIYTYYSSSLLSHMVAYKDETLAIKSLMESNMGLVTIDYTYWIVASDYINKSVGKSAKISEIRKVNVTEGLEAVRSRNAAMLSDFVSLYPIMRKTFTADEKCNVKEINIYSNIQKYFTTSKTFAYKEQFKIGLLKMKERGLLRRLILDAYSSHLGPKCSESAAHTYATFNHILVSLITMGSTYMLAVIVLLAEIWYYRRNRVYPFVN